MDDESYTVVPAPPIYIRKDLLEEYSRLYRGIRDREDMVTWRTLIVKIKLLLGSRDPEHKRLPSGTKRKANKLVMTLVKDTYLEILTPEIFYALGYQVPKNRVGKIDVLLFNGRHNSEPLLWTLADKYRQEGKSVAVVNPVGHYNDGQSRTLVMEKLISKVDKLIIIASTQIKYGGSLTVLANVIRTLRNPAFSRKINSVNVVIPMFGGSRGHRISQSDEIGYEILEAIFNAKVLSLTTGDVIRKIRKDTKKVPKVKFFSIDIHSRDYPAEVFGKSGFPFISINPSFVFADEIHKLLDNKKLLHLPIRVVSCDRGAELRTEALAERLINHPENSINEVDIIYIEKKRITAGVTTEAKICKISRWSLGKKGRVDKKTVMKMNSRKELYKEFVLIYSDDMIDTGGTAKKDLKLLAGKFPNARFKVFTATHPVLSKGTGVLDEIEVDKFLLGNTLNVKEVWEHPKAVKLDMAPAIFEELR